MLWKSRSVALVAGHCRRQEVKLYNPELSCTKPAPQTCRLSADSLQEICSYVLVPVLAKYEQLVSSRGAITTVLDPSQHQDRTLLVESWDASSASDCIC